MPLIQLGTYSYRRADGLTPEIETKNVYSEPAPANLKTQVDLYTRPNLEAFATVGSGPIRCIYQKADAFSGDAFVVSGTALYRVTSAGVVSSSLGTISGTGIVQIAGSSTLLHIANGSTPRSTDGITVSDIVFPDTANVVSVGFINGYHLAVRASSHRIYYLDLNTGLYDATRFISAERYPDNVLKIMTTSDEVWAMGGASTEVFVPTGVDTADSPPFQRVEGRLYKKGLLTASCVVEADNTILWIGQSEDAGLEAYRGGDVPEVISTPAMSERFARAVDNTLSVWAFGILGHLFWVCALGSEGTWVYDIPNKRWFEWSSYARDQWRAWLGRGCWPGVVIAGDDELGKLYSLSDTGTTDATVQIEQVWTAGVSLDKRAPINSLQLDCAVGQGAGVIMLEFSDDQGRTWTSHNDWTLILGRYWQQPRWTRLGQAQPPGRVFRWTVTDPVRMRISSARVNDPI